MLTLFKPWRNGKDLKEKDYSWDETFANYNFTEDQIQLMHNFNVPYECQDARHDFSNQLKKQNTSDNLQTSWMSIAGEMLELEHADHR